MALTTKEDAYFHRDVNSLLISNGEIDYGRLVKSLKTFESDQLFRPVVIENNPSSNTGIVMKNLDHFWAAVCLNRKVTCRLGHPRETQIAPYTLHSGGIVTATGQEPHIHQWNIYQHRIEKYCKEHGLAFNSALY